MYGSLTDTDSMRDHIASNDKSDGWMMD